MDKEHRFQPGNTESGCENVLLLGGIGCRISKSGNRNGIGIHCELCKLIQDTQLILSITATGKYIWKYPAH